MSETQSPTTFAFGQNKVNGCKCPALAADMDPGGTDAEMVPGLLEVVSLYDDLMIDSRDVLDGTVGEEIAKEVWKDVMVNHTEEGTSQRIAAEKVAMAHEWI